MVWWYQQLEMSGSNRGGWDQQRMEAPTQGGTFGVLISGGFPLVLPTVSARPNSGSFAARHGTTTRSFAAFKSPMGGKGCAKCRGKGAVECPGCKGSGKNKKNGNLFERWKCFDCQGFGLVSCPNCGKGGLTPEQRGER